MNALLAVKAKRVVRQTASVAFTAIHKVGLTRFNLIRKKRRVDRRLEIGPGDKRINGFETLNVVGWFNVDYVHDATRTLPFEDGTFEVVYASHILEHVPWYHTEQVLKEWVRVIRPGGTLELWVPDGLKIARSWVEAEDGRSSTFHEDGWYKYNERKDPCVWANGRFFSYGDGTGRKGHQNWHMAVFSSRLLAQLLRNAGLHGVCEMHAPHDVRGYDHGWINLGMRGKKPNTNK